MRAQLVRLFGWAAAGWLLSVAWGRADEDWSFRVPPSASFQKTVDADWRDYSLVEVDVQCLDGHVRAPLYAAFFFQNKQDQWFQIMNPVRLTGKVQRLSARLDQNSPDLQCVSARRPFAPDALRWVRGWGIKVFSDQDLIGRLRIRNLRLSAAMAATPWIGDGRMKVDPVAGAWTPVQMRLHGFRGNPFNRGEVSVNLEVTGDGGTRTIPMYYVQEFADFRQPGLEEDRRMAMGIPVWQANWRPEQTGECRLRVQVQADSSPLESDWGSFHVGSPPPHAVVASPSGPPGGEFVGTRVSRLFEYRGGRWDCVSVDPAPTVFWDVRLDWTPAWGNYTGMGEFDQLTAWNFERALAGYAGGRALPVLLFDEDELDDSGRYNWVDNPLNGRNGGPLEKPYRQFGESRAGRIVLDRARYLVARYGRYEAFGGLMLLSGGEEREVVDWVTRTAAAVAREHPGVRIFGSSPRLAERVGRRATDFAAKCDVDSRLSSGTSVVHDRETGEAVVSGTATETLAAVRKGIQHWAGESAFSCELRPVGIPDREIAVMCFLRTDAVTVFQSGLVPLGVDRWNRVSFSLDRPSEWSCLEKPTRRLEAYDLMNIREVGLRFFHPRQNRVEVRVRQCALLGPYRAEVERQAALAISDLRGDEKEVGQYGRIELDFQLNRVFRNPYDPQEVDVAIELKDPNGQERRHPGYFNEPWEPAMIESVEQPVRQGRPSWRVRVSPWIPGEWTWRVRVKAGREEATVDGAFTCVAGRAPGFVRVSEKDRRYFEFSDGRFYFPIGHNLRSPDDVRSENRDEAVTRNLDWARRSGTRAYDTWFQRMRENGENFSRVWMSPWWCGLEWSDSHEGYHGLGYYNQGNAARLDRIMEAAEREGIYVNLETMNHGQLSTKVDEDWVGNPLSQTTQPGGYLPYASQFFDSSKAKEAHRNRLRYTIARWGYSPAIAWWGVMTEVEWVEAYFRGLRERDPRDKVADAPWIPKPYDTDRYQRKVLDWIDETCRYVRETDAHPHLVSAHFSMAYYGEELWSRRNVDVVHNNTYTELVEWWRGAPLGGDDGIADVVMFFGKYYAAYAESKPLMVGEWGGSPYGSSPSHLSAELRTGTWVMSMTRCAGSTGFWWWNVVDAKNLYAIYRPLAAFMVGEDRRGKQYQSARLPVTFAGAGGAKDRRAAAALYNSGELFAYVYRKECNRRRDSRAAASFDDSSFAASGEGSMEAPDLLGDGTYGVEYWNTFTGEPISTGTVDLTATSRRIPLLDHRVDLALKMKRNASPAAIPAWPESSPDPSVGR